METETVKVRWIGNMNPKEVGYEIWCPSINCWEPISYAGVQSAMQQAVVHINEQRPEWL